jgi:hypothetical protein
MALVTRGEWECPMLGCRRILSSAKRLAQHTASHGPTFRLIDAETGDVWAYNNRGRPHLDHRWMKMVAFMSTVSDLLDISIADREVADDRG